VDRPFFFFPGIGRGVKNKLDQLDLLHQVFFFSSIAAGA